MPNTTTILPPATTVRPRALRVLRLLFELAQSDRPAHVGALAAHLGQTPPVIAELLLELDHAGYARAEHARLTMAGLVLASRLPALATPSRAPSAPSSRAVRRARAPRQLPAGWAPDRSRVPA